MHTHAYAAVARWRPAHAERVYEVGSLNINGSVRSLFPDARYHGIDVVAGPGVDVVGDGATYVPPFVPDCIVCCEVLEHAPDPAAVILRMASVLGSRGTLIVTCAGPGRAPHSGIDGGTVRAGEYYANVQPDDLRDWLLDAGLTRCVVETGVGVFQALAAPATGLHGDVYAVAVKP